MTFTTYFHAQIVPGLANRNAVKVSSMSYHSFWIISGSFTLKMDVTAHVFALSHLEPPISLRSPVLSGVEEAIWTPRFGYFLGNSLLLGPYCF